MAMKSQGNKNDIKRQVAGLDNQQARSKMPIQKKITSKE